MKPQGAALGSTQLLDALLYGISAVDPLVFVVMTALMLAVGCWPATCPRAARAP